ncbi:MAG: HAD family hydrolase [Promethearchaeota archaeon]|nr:MAG: HAD family hydrolase [Candidatus Lokiarchaeota archaeon]
MNWHSIDKEEVFNKLKSTPKGLSEEEVKRRLAVYGFNQLKEDEPINKFAILIAQLKNPIISIILITAFITFIFGKYADTIVIILVVLFNTIIGYLQEYKAETSLQALKLMVSPECDVIRDCPEEKTCIEMRIKANEIVPGDVILLEGGDKVPADARIFEAINLEIDESMLTGESVSVKKIVNAIDEEVNVADRRNIAYAGTVITYGRGKAVVVETGMNTEIGQIAELIKGTEKEKTPLQSKLSDLVKIFAIVALIASGTTFLLGIILGIELFEIFFFAVASVVSAIPEGLPVVMTITLAVGVNRMAKRKAIIRKLHAVDTLGAATVICTDKTGTLTTNQMTVRKIFVDNKFIDVTGAGFTPEGKFEINGEEIEINSLKTLIPLLKTATLCNNARLRSHKLETEERVWDVYGDPTEGALLVLSAKKGIHKEEIEENYTRIDEIPFNSKLKYMVTFHKNSSKEILVYLKGAPEVVLNLCSKIFLNGDIIDLTQVEIDKINEITFQMAKNALRNLAFASQTISIDQLESFKEALERGEKKLVFQGVVGMIDPPRPEVKDSIKLCKKAGIMVIMATGDHKITAEAIGTEIGILKKGSLIVTGEDLKSMSEEELDDKIDNISIFARVSPEDKYKIVSSLKRKNHIVCMTGDGVNDAPALKAADIGVAMGIAGTEVAKEASEMVLTDDDFSSIVSAVEEGRVIFQNIRKVVKYLVCTNVGEIAVIILALILLPILFGETFLIFTPVQILWVNLVTDGVLDVTLAMEGKESDVMAHKPRRPEEPIFNKEILVNIVFVGVLMMFGTLFMFIYALNQYNVLLKAQTMAFTTMAMFQVFNSLNCRSRTKSLFEMGMTSNKYLIGAIILSITLQICAVYLIIFNALLGTVPLLPFDWLLIVLISSSVFIGDEIRKALRKQVIKRKYSKTSK